MKILWFSNKVFSDKDTGTGGTWLEPMALSLVATGMVELCNIALGKVKTPTRQDFGPISQWIVPNTNLARDGLPPIKIVKRIIDIVDDFSSDLVHIWGTETFWGLLTARGHIQSRKLLEIQGLKEPCARVYAGGLSVREQLTCIGLKGLIKRRSVASGRRTFEKWSLFEREIIAGHQFITTQSPWAEAWVKKNNASARIFHTELALREAFYNAKPWRAQKDPVIFSSSAYPVPYKGIHDALRAIAILKKPIPNMRFRIAGALQSRGIRQDGYIAWINRLAASLHVKEHVEWIGPLTATEIIAELQNSSVMLMPSHCETYCMAFAEALYLGVPSVTAHTGGTDWLARDNESALFFFPGDEVMCAYQLERLLTNQALAEQLSQKSRGIALVRNHPELVIENQIEIYRQVIEQTEKVIY